MDLVNDHSLSQCEQDPTCENNILDLLFTTNPDLVRSAKVDAGMSDHRVVIAELDLKAKLNKKKPGKVYLYKKMCGEREQLTQCFPQFNDDSSLEDTWSAFNSWWAFSTSIWATRESLIPRRLDARINTAEIVDIYFY